MFLHVENVSDSHLEKLKKENELIMKDIANLETTIRDLDEKILKSEDIINKLVDVEKRFERVVVIEKTVFEQSSTIETLTTKVTSLETKLNEKDSTIQDLVDKVEMLMEKEKLTLKQIQKKFLRLK